MSTAKTPPLLPGASSTQTKAILGAMRAVAETGGAATKEDQVALASADQYIFGHDAPFAFAMITPVAPAALASALAEGDLPVRARAKWRANTRWPDTCYP